MQHDIAVIVAIEDIGLVERSPNVNIWHGTVRLGYIDVQCEVEKDDDGVWSGLLIYDDWKSKWDGVISVDAWIERAEQELAKWLEWQDSCK